ncbi:MAG: hypothetical protein M3P85_11070 [Actinomycetota bacterium]|nr:hypothetical protein [Actinomycetota bacterium]
MKVDVTHHSTDGFRPWSGSLRLPGVFEADFDEPGRPFLVHLVIEVHSRQLRCRRLECTSRGEDDFISADAIHRLPLPAYMRIAAAMVAMETATEGGVMELDPVGNEATAELEAALGSVGRRRFVLTDEHLAEVAKVYIANPKTPTKAVAEHFFTSRQNAGKWVRAARDAGLISKEEQR